MINAKKLFDICCLGIVMSIMTVATNARSVVTTPTPGVFPIVASTVFDPLGDPNKEDLEDVVECGFNLCMETSTASKFEKFLNCMDGIGLKILMQDSESFQIYSSDGNDYWKKKIPEFVNKFKNNPMVAGWKFYDEPRWEQLPELRKRYKLLLDTDDTHFVSINLVGEISKIHTGPCRTLEEYLDTIQDYFSPLDVWSSDCYPIWIRNGHFMVRYNEFYSDLEAYALKSRETGVPMWAYCGSMSFSTNHHDVPPATLAHLSFEAFSALAYGAQGLVYWTYRQRPSTSYENYKSALVDISGNKTESWYSARLVNKEIRVLTPVFLGAEMIECRHTGNIPLGRISPFAENFGPLKRLTNGDKGVLVSHLRNKGHDYLVVVNHDVLNSQKVRFIFRNDVKVTRLSVSASGDLSQYKVADKYDIILSPGGYSIFEWEK